MYKCQSVFYKIHSPPAALPERESGKGGEIRAERIGIGKFRAAGVSMDITEGDNPCN